MKTKLILFVLALSALANCQSVPASGPADPRNSPSLSIYDWTAPLNWPNNATEFLRGDRTWSTTPGGASVLVSAKVSLTSAQLKNLFAVPVVLVAAQGPSKAIHVVGFFMHYKFGTIAYANAGGGNFTVSINPAAGDFSFSVTATGFITTVSDEIQSFTQTSSFFGPLADADNQSLQISKATANLTAGDGTLDITILYAVVDLT